jgi:hypothetical protein
MKRFVLMWTLAGLFLAGVAVAQDKCEGKCPATQTTSLAGDDDRQTTGQCPIEAAMEKLPAIAYKVGGEAACCKNSAAALAKKSGKPIEYTVGDKSYSDEHEAFTALVETTEKFVANFTTPCKCEVSGKTTVAGESCDCPIKAEEMAQAVKKATDAVAMTYTVGKDACDCPVQAKEMATKSGEKIVYTVNGESCECEMTARLNLARAKYRAAVEALTQMEQPAAKIN